MNYFKLRLWLPTNDIFIPRQGHNKKNVCLFFYGENVELFDAYNYMGISQNNVRYVYVPTFTSPVRSYMDSDTRAKVRSYGLKPERDFVGNYTKMYGRNFFYYAQNYIDKINERYKVKRYNTGRGYELHRKFINILDGVPSDKFERVLLYSINTDKEFPDKLLFRKFYILYTMLMEWKNEGLQLPFDTILLYLFNKDEGKYIKIFDVNLGDKNNIQRIRSSVMKVRYRGSQDEIVKDIIGSEENVDKTVSSSVNNYMNSDVTIDDDLTIDLDQETQEKIRNTSLLYNVTGDITKSKRMANSLNKLPDNQKNQIISNLKTRIIPKEDTPSTSRNETVKLYELNSLTDKQNISHLIKKRDSDFNESLVEDITNMFKLLEEKDLPFKIKGVSVKEMKSPTSSINKSVKNRYLIKLEDMEGETYEVYIDMPKLGQDGTFLVNGQRKVLINQLVRYPIFFTKVNEARFESSFATIRVVSKQLQNKTAYFLLYMGNYRIPLILYLFYAHGFEKILNEYGINYTLNRHVEEPETIEPLKSVVSNLEDKYDESTGSYNLSKEEHEEALLDRIENLNWDFEQQRKSDEYVLVLHDRYDPFMDYVETSIVHKGKLLGTGNMIMTIGALHDMYEKGTLPKEQPVYLMIDHNGRPEQLKELYKNVITELKHLGLKYEWSKFKN